MKISQLLEFVNEDFGAMDQRAQNIQQGQGNVTNAQARQARISQLAANQRIRNTAPAGKPMGAPATTPAAPASTTPASTTPATAAPASTTPATAAPASTTPAQGAPAPTATGSRVGNVLGKISTGLGAVAGGIAGAGRAFGKGYNAGAYAVGGPSTKVQFKGMDPGNRMGGLKQTVKTRGKSRLAAAPASNAPDELEQLKQAIANIDQRLSKAGV